MRGALDKLEAFASLNGPAFYGLPVSQEQVLLERREHVAPDVVMLPEGDGILPFRGGEALTWAFAGGGLRGSSLRGRKPPLA